MYNLQPESLGHYKVCAKVVTMALEDLATHTTWLRAQSKEDMLASPVWGGGGRPWGTHGKGTLQEDFTDKTLVLLKAFEFKITFTSWWFQPI